MANRRYWPKSYCFAVEDSPDIIQSIAPLVDKLFVMDYPYNRHLNYPNMVRVRDWQELKNHLRRVGW